MSGKCTTFACIDVLFPEPSMQRDLWAYTMLAIAAYYIFGFVAGFIKGVVALVTVPKTGVVSSDERAFSWKMYFCLCATESATPVACGIMLCDSCWIGGSNAALLAVSINCAGYLKYYAQMVYNKDYVATSIFIYTLSFLTLSVLQKDPLYFALMWYPFRYVLLKVPKYGDMRGRGILYDDASIILHSVDHIIHGLITW